MRERVLIIVAFRILYSYFFLDSPSKNESTLFL